MEEKQNKNAKKAVNVQRMVQELNKSFISLAISEALVDASIEQLVEIIKILNI